MTIRSLWLKNLVTGLEALYWASKYPDEITAIIGLDMAVPAYYEDMKINMPLLKLANFAANIGITRLMPGISESEAIKHGSLTDSEKDIYRAIFYNRTATSTMIHETEFVKANAKIVERLGVPQVPMYLFISDGSGGTGFNKETWRQIAEQYITQNENGWYMELDCPHYVQDYEYNSFGNGSAMRVSSVAWLYNNINAVRHVARFSAEVTHNHAEGIKGAEATASAIFLARTNHSKAEIKKYIEQECEQNWKKCLDTIKNVYYTIEKTFRSAYYGFYGNKIRGHYRNTSI